MKGELVMAALVAGALASGCPAQLSATLLPDFRDCAGFWQCAGGQPLFHACPQGLHFSARLQRCTLPVFARCQALAGDAPVHTGFMSGLLDTLRHVIRGNAQSVVDELSAPPELPSGDLSDEEDTVRRYPDAEAVVADGDTKGAEKSKENEEQQSADKGEENELDTMEEKEQEDQEEDGKEEGQDDTERSEEKIEREEDEIDGDKEESEGKINEISEDIAVENDGANKQDSKKDATVLKKKEEEEEDEKKKKFKDVKRIEKESKKNKPEEKEKDSESDAESDDEE